MSNTTTETTTTNAAAVTGHEPVKSSPKAEAKAFIAKVYALGDEGAALGPLAVGEVARLLGLSANDYGRPSAAEFVAYMLAVSQRKLAMNARVQLAQTANGAAGGAKLPFRIKAKASAGEGQLSYKLSLPATFEVEIG